MKGYMIKKKLCECGCGQPTIRNGNYPHNFNRFIHGHQGNRTGTHHSEETKRKISVGNTGKIRTREMRKRYSKAKKGIKFTEEHKRKIGEVRKGKTYEEIYGAKKAKN